MSRRTLTLSDVSPVGEELDARQLADLAGGARKDKPTVWTTTDGSRIGTD